MNSYLTHAAQAMTIVQAIENGSAVEFEGLVDTGYPDQAHVSLIVDGKPVELEPGPLLEALYDLETAAYDSGDDDVSEAAGYLASAISAEAAYEAIIRGMSEDGDERRWEMANDR